LLFAVDLNQSPSKDPQDLKLGFDHYTCQDRFHRTIDFYLSKSNGKLPLAVLVMGSGAQSMWVKRGNQVFGGLQNLLATAAKGRFRVLAVEKPGVPFAYQPKQPGTAEGAPKAFLEEHTLERWTEAVDAAIRACHTLPEIDPARTLAIGHSEGGIVVARLAAIDPQVTDVAVLAGGGPSQIFDSLYLFGREATEKGVAEIRTDPMSPNKLIWGQPYRRWTTFFGSSPLEEALKSKARFLIVQGTNDKNVYPPSADVLYAGLLGHDRDVELETIEGADHGFTVNPADPPGADFTKVFTDVLAWFSKVHGPARGSRG
jgi:pimeloyl-ACP methyl ester carboxylesterase